MKFTHLEENVDGDAVVDFLANRLVELGQLFAQLATTLGPEAAELIPNEVKHNKITKQDWIDVAVKETKK